MRRRSNFVWLVLAVLAAILIVYLGWPYRAEIFSKSMLENLLAQGIGIAVTVWWIDRLLQRRAAREAQRQWLPARRVFKARLERSISNFVNAFGGLEGWGSKYVGAFHSDGPEEFAALVRSRSRAAEILVRAEISLERDRDGAQRLAEATTAFNGIYCEAVMYRAELLRRELEDFLLANLPGAFSPDILNGAWAAHDKIKTLLEPGRIDDTFTAWMTDAACNRPFLLADLLASVLSSLDPLWRWVVAPEHKASVA